MCYFGRAESRWSSEEYPVLSDRVQEIVQKLGVQPERDAFAREGNQRFEHYWGPGSTEGEDAFNQYWGDQLLWINPPYGVLDKVVAKLGKDGAHAILVVPEWPHRIWHREAMKLCVKSILFPENIWFFGMLGPRRRRSLWPVRAMLVCGHHPRCGERNFDPNPPKPQVHFGGGNYYFAFGGGTRPGQVRQAWGEAN